MSRVEFSEIVESDDADIAKIIREALLEYRTADQLKGTVFYDDETDRLHTIFIHPKSCYYIAKVDGKIVGGGGIYPSPALEEDTVEVVKMYLHESARGHKIGLKLLQKCEEKASELGYKKLYIETLPELKEARRLYEKYGFKYIDASLGNTGHDGCDVWMIKQID